MSPQARWSRRDRRWLGGACAAVTLLVLAPLLAPGYVLSYDLVFVPHQALRWELLAPSAGLPRAVPQDAVVALLSTVAPGWLWERVALAGAVFLAAMGAGRLVPTQRLLVRLVAAVGYAWTPFLAERLLLGQWGLLLAYGALPWLVAAAMGVRAGRPGALPRLVLAASVSVLTPTGGLVALATVVVLTVAGARPWWRGGGLAVGAVAVLNAPWVLATLTTTAGARSDPAGVAAFAVRGENWSGPVGAVAGTGGIWNAQTAPGSRASLLVPVVTLVLLAVAVAGFGVLRRRWASSEVARVSAVAGGGILLAVAGVVPVTARALAWSMASVPGAGLFRDGQKFLMPYALLLTVCIALGAERLAVRLAEPRARLVLVAALALPVAAMPDLAFGGMGQLRPVAYPPDWDRVAAAVAAAPGDVLALPLSEYRRYTWNHDRIVIDPAPRYLPTQVVADDRLRVGDVVLQGEDPRVAQVGDLLAAGRPVAQSGIAWILVQHDASTAVRPEELAGLQIVYKGQFCELYANPLATAGGSPGSRTRWLVLGLDLTTVGLLIAASWQLRRAPTPW